MLPRANDIKRVSVSMTNLNTSLQTYRDFYVQLRNYYFAAV